LSVSAILWKRSEKLVTPLIFLVALGVLARAQTIFSPLLSIDTYEVAATSDPSVKFETLVQQGRFGLMALWWLRGVLGVWGPSASSISLMLSVPLLALSGLLFAFSISRGMTIRSATFLAAIYSLHPFLTEIYYFSDAAFNIFFATCLASIGTLFMLQEDRQRASWLVGVATLTVAISVYQLVVAHIGTVWLLAVVARTIGDKGSPSSFIATYRREIRALAIMALSLAAYLVTAALIAKLTGWPLDGRNSFSGLLDVSTKVDAVRQALTLGYFPSSGLVPPLATTLLLIVLSISAGYVVVQAMLRRGVWSAALVVVCLTAALVWSASASAVGDIVWIVPRVVSPASLFIGGLVALMMEGGNRTTKRVMTGSVLIILISYLGASNSILYDQRRINLWDAQQANRLVARLEEQPDFHKMKKLALVGGQWWRTTPLPTAVGDMNVSALAVGWAKVQLISHATGYLFQSPDLSEQASAERECEDRLLWPAVGSVFQMEELGVICLTRPK
jgi:hypothetical protein